MPYKACLVVVLLCSCVVLESGTKTSEIPSVWQEDYGTIAYQDNVTNENGKLTKFWAQEAIGAPESREFIAELKAQGVEIKRQGIGVLESEMVSFDKKGLRGVDISIEAFRQLCSIKIKPCNKHLGDHGTLVTNLIADNSPVGISSTGIISTINRIGNFNVEKKKLPSIVNLSGFISDRSLPKYQEAFSHFVDQTIVVLSSGNNFPELPNRLVTQYSKKTVVVGSVDPTGFVSEFSQSIDDLVVLAPSDVFVTSRGAAGSLELFNGTSGAAPQVTGALADIKSILPSLTRDESILLLKRTSTPTAINQVSTANGAGTLNQYRALRVAKRLKDKGFPTDRQALLNDDSIYDFKNEAQKLADDAITDPKLRLKNLRKAFFLDPDNTPIRKSLADLYSSYNLSIQSRFYDDPQQVIKLKNQRIKLVNRDFLSTTEQVRKLFKDANATIPTYTLNKYFGEMSRDNKPALARVASDPEKIMRTAIEAAGYLADNGAVEPLQLLVERAKITYPDLLTEKHISKIVKKHTGNLGKLINAIKKNATLLKKVL